MPTAQSWDSDQDQRFSVSATRRVCDGQLQWLVGSPMATRSIDPWPSSGEGRRAHARPGSGRREVAAPRAGGCPVPATKRRRPHSLALLLALLLARSLSFARRTLSAAVGAGCPRGGAELTIVDACRKPHAGSRHSLQSAGCTATQSCACSTLHLRNGAAVGRG